MSNISILIACYPKVGSQFLKKMLVNRIPRDHSDDSIVTTTHTFNLNWLKNGPPQRSDRNRVVGDTKIIYLYSNPLNSVLSLIRTFMPRRELEYKASLVHAPIDIDIAMSYANLFACGLTQDRNFDQHAWTGHTTLLKDAAYVSKVLSPNLIDNLCANFVSYMVNGDLLGYKNHYELWTKHYPLKYPELDFCMVRYEDLDNPEVLYHLKKFLDPKIRTLDNIVDNYIPRRTNYIHSDFASKLEESYGGLASELFSHPPFVKLKRE
jgi:hypothetical protein